MEDKRKRLIIVSVSIAIILIITIVLTIKLILIKKNSGNEVISNTVGAEENIVQENEIGNTVENITENNENNTTENVNDQNTNLPSNDAGQNTPVADPEQEVDKETIQKQETDKEKAINIAKKDWGTDNSVYFSYEGTSNGKSIVSVRSNDTTRALRYYYINVNNGSFDIEE